MADQQKTELPIKSDLWRAFMAQYQKRQQAKRIAIANSPTLLLDFTKNIYAVGEQ